MYTQELYFGIFIKTLSKTFAKSESNVNHQGLGLRNVQLIFRYSRRNGEYFIVILSLNKVTLLPTLLLLLLLLLLLFSNWQRKFFLFLFGVLLKWKYYSLCLLWVAINKYNIYGRRRESWCTQTRATSCLSNTRRMNFGEDGMVLM